MNLGGLLGGTIGGALGAGIWAFIAWKTDFEVGYVAWLIGAMVGGGVYFGSKRRADKATGIMAVSLAALAVIGGKYAATWLVVEREIAAYETEGAPGKGAMIGFLAEEIVMERTLAGQEVAWPEGAMVGAEEVKYPEDILVEARSRWAAMSAAEQENQINTVAMTQAIFLDQVREYAMTDGFEESFTQMDLLFFGLAVVSAFRIGAGNFRQTPRPLPA